jgi:lipopolysaccharide transport system permease protein
LRENLLPQTIPSLDDESQTPVVIEPIKGWFSFDFREFWEYRELLYFFLWRDIKVRYKQTMLGALWVILQPVMTMVVFSVFFGGLAKIPSDSVPYPIFTYAALLPWQLFVYSIAATSQSLVMDQGLITKVYFPRLFVPLSAILVGLIDFVIAFTVLVGMMFYYQIHLTWAILTLPLFLLLALLIALAIGIWASALNVQYRDVRYLIPFLTQFWLFITPVAYPASLVPDQWRLLYGLNPMVGVVEGFRWALLGQHQTPDSSIIISVLVVIILLASGLLYFNHIEKTFADVI